MLLLWSALLLVVVAAAALWWWRPVAQGGAELVASLRAQIPTATVRGWQRQTVGDLSVEAPFTFAPGADVSAEVPAEIRALIQHWQTHEAAPASGEVRVQLSHIVYRPGVALDLDGAVEGAMSNAAAALGDRDPDFTAEPVQISGLEARRSTYRGTAAGQPLQIDALFVQRGQQFWQVQAFSSSPDASRLVMRLLESVRILPPSEPTALVNDSPSVATPEP